MPRKKKGGGGKLNRSEIVQARLNPKLRFVAEIMARYERRTLSSLFEGLLEKAMKNYVVDALVHEKEQISLLLFGESYPQRIQLKDLIESIWSVEDADRFASFAMCLPDLLTEEEAQVWSLIRSTPYFWEHFEINIENKSGATVGKDVWPITTYRGLIREHIREHWDLLNAIARGEEPKEKLTELALPVGKIVKKPKHIAAVKKVVPDDN